MRSYSSEEKFFASKHAMVPVPTLCGDPGLCVVITKARSLMSYGEFIVRGTYSDMVGRGYPVSVLPGRTTKDEMKGVSIYVRVSGKGHLR